MQRTSWWGWKWMVWGLATLFVLLFVGLPLLSSLILTNADALPENATRYLGLIEYGLTYSMVGLAAIWIFAVGSSFASFLNVVAWRVPRGKSILGSSHCPFCNVQLTFRDNIPVLGWLKNAGRCSNCRLPIGPRYLVVEIVLGVIFLAATLSLLLSAGGILPFVSRPDAMSLNRLLLEPRACLLAILSFHLTAIMMVFTFALIEQERMRIPISIYAIGTVILLAIVSYAPAAVIVPWEFPFQAKGLPLDRLNAILSWLFGGAFGWIFGVLVGWLANLALQAKESPRRHFTQVYLGFSVVGMIAGWQSVLVVGLFWLIGRSCFGSQSNSTAAMSFNGVVSLPHSILMFGLLFHLACWRWFEFFVMA